jgi:hypothetical protein
VAKGRNAPVIARLFHKGITGFDCPSLEIHEFSSLPTIFIHLSHHKPPEPDFISSMRCHPSGMHPNTINHGR